MKRLLLCFAFLVLLAGAAVSHESRPAYLELQQTSEDNYDLLWKVPARGSNMRLGLYVRLPIDCKIVRLPSSTFLGGAFIERSTISRAGSHCSDRDRASSSRWSMLACSGSLGRGQ